MKDQYVNTTIQNEDTVRLFKMQALEELYSFMDLVDTIYNPLNVPKINIVFCTLLEWDTIIEFSMYVTLPYIDPEFCDASLERACNMNGENVVVYNIGLKNENDKISVRFFWIYHRFENLIIHLVYSTFPK